MDEVPLGATVFTLAVVEYPLGATLAPVFTLAVDDSESESVAVLVQLPLESTLELLITLAVDDGNSDDSVCVLVPLPTLEKFPAGSNPSAISKPKIARRKSSSEA